jgi:hypothetical protein
MILQGQSCHTSNNKLDTYMLMALQSLVILADSPERERERERKLGGAA